MAKEITSSDDLIDVRDVIERFEELEEERQALADALEEAQESLDEHIEAGEGDEITLTQAVLEEARDDARSDLASWDSSDESTEKALLAALLEDLKGNGGDHQWQVDWYPVSLIHDSYFETAMDEMLEDIGDMPKNIPSYLTITVNYDALQMDYSSVEFDGATYWYR